MEKVRKKKLSCAYAQISEHLWGVETKLHTFLTPVLMEKFCQLHAPAALRMEAVRTSKTWLHEATTQKTKLHTRRRENLTSHKRNDV
jgi:hypothetical protein